MESKSPTWAGLLGLLTGRCWPLLTPAGPILTPVVALSCGHEQNWSDRTANKCVYSGMDSDGKAERNAKIYARRIEGFTLRAIAREFELAVETVRGIAKCMERKAKWRGADRA